MRLNIPIIKPKEKKSLYYLSKESNRKELVNKSSKVVDRIVVENSSEIVSERLNNITQSTTKELISNVTVNFHRFYHLILSRVIENFETLVSIENDTPQRLRRWKNGLCM